MQTTSEDKGVPFIEAHEGVVLTAYRCPAGKWTIGAGLTAASGVVTPRAGMTITRAEASRLLKLALARNYEPAVRQALRPVASHAFDGAVSFHFNTGAIARASWVGSYKTRDWSGHGSRSGTRVAGACSPASIAGDVRRPTSSCSTSGRAICGSLPVLHRPRVETDLVEGVTDLCNLGRRLDRQADAIGSAARARRPPQVSKQGGAGAAGGAAAAGGNEAVAPDPSAEPGIVGDPWITAGGIVVTVIAILFLAYLAWHYRDLIAARIQGFAARLPGWLRSF
jgi:lysozyme